MTVRKRRPLRAGEHVRVTSGPARGRVGVVQTHGLDGVAVRLVALDACWPFTEVKVFPASDLVRVPRPRPSVVPAAQPALM